MFKVKLEYFNIINEVANRKNVLKAQDERNKL